MVSLYQCVSCRMKAQELRDGGNMSGIAPEKKQLSLTDLPRNIQDMMREYAREHPRSLEYWSYDEAFRNDPGGTRADHLMVRGNIEHAQERVESLLPRIKDACNDKQIDWQDAQRIMWELEHPVQKGK